MQTVFVILICNNQLLDWIENEFIRVVSHIPGLASILPDVITKLKALREKYMKAPHQASLQKIQVPIDLFVGWVGTKSNKLVGPVGSAKFFLVKSVGSAKLKLVEMGKE